MKKFLLFTISFLFVNLALSQITWTNSVHINAGGGIHTLHYKPVNGITSTKLGFIFEAQYHRELKHNLSLGVGVNFMSLKGQASYNYTFKQTGIILPGANYPSIITTTFNDWVEMQNTFQFSIPMEAYYRFNLSGFDLIAGAGFAVSLPISSGFKTKEGTFSRTAYMDTVGVDFYDLPNHGLGKFDSIYSGTLKGKVNVAFVFDIGADIYTTDSYKIYAGIYGSFALSPLFRSENTVMFDEKLGYHGSLTSDQVDRVKYYTIGIKLGVALGINKKRDNNQNIKGNNSSNTKDQDINYNDKELQKKMEEARNKALKRAEKTSKEENKDINYDDPNVKKAIEEAKQKAKNRAKEESTK